MCPAACGGEARAPAQKPATHPRLSSHQPTGEGAGLAGTAFVCMSVAVHVQCYSRVSFIQPILSRSIEVLCCRTMTASACRRAVPYCGTWHPNTMRQTTGTQARLSLYPNQILQKPSANSDMPPDCMAPEKFCCACQGSALLWV